MNEDVLKKDIERYKKRVGYTPDVYNPRSQTEHIMYKKFFNRNPMLVETSDKIAVREWVKSCGLEDILVPIYAADYARLEAVEKYPCMVKMNNACARCVTVRDEKDKKKAIKAVRRWFPMKYGAEKGEWCYQDIKPGYVIEPLLWEKEERHSYHKISCYNGEPQFIDVHEYEWQEKKKIQTMAHTIFSLEWEVQNVSVDDHPRNEGQHPPKTIDKMIKVAKILSQSFDFVRVDLFEYDGKVMFSEVTHYPKSGQHRYDPTDFDFYLGSFWR